MRAEVHAGPLILVNRRFPFDERAGLPPLAPVRKEFPQVLLAREAAERLDRLMDELDGWSSIVPVSGWRSRGEQEEIYAQSLRDNGPEFTAQYVALPGHSEHQTGLAIDLGLNGPELDELCPDFPYEGICQKFRLRAAAYGFVERYPAGKEAVTGISHEPWHFRYVGEPHAQIMAERGLTLEEYHELLKGCPLGEAPLRRRVGAREYAISYAGAAGKGQKLREREGLSLSGDNESGLIVTAWKEGEYGCEDLADRSVQRGQPPPVLAAFRPPGADEKSLAARTAAPPPEPHGPETRGLYRPRRSHPGRAPAATWPPRRLYLPLR